MSDINDLARQMAEAQGERVVALLIEWFQKGGCVVVPEYLNAKQAAAFCGFSASAFEHHRARGTGPRALRVGQQKYRYSVSDLRSWMESHAVQLDFEPSTKSINYGGAK